MALPGAEGGLSTNRMDFTMESTKYVDDCINDSQHVHRLVDMNEIMNARNDRHWETKQLVNAIKPRAWPVWGIPAELLLIALLPKYRCTARRGVGITNSLVAPVFNKRFDDMRSCIRRTEATPVVWHRSRVFFATKPGAVEPNLKAVQMPHGFDATGMAWYGGRRRGLGQQWGQASSMGTWVGTGQRERGRTFVHRQFELEVANHWCLVRSLEL